jgi:hypothetical protein
MVLPLAQSATVTIPAAADTSMFQDFPNNNFGSMTNMASGAVAHGSLTRALLKFDIAGHVPAGAVISGVQLRLSVIRAASFGSQPSTFSLYRVMNPWGEGNKATAPLGAPATTGEATWLNRFHPSTPWSAPGGVIGVDFASSPSLSAPVAEPAVYTFDSTPVAIGDAQQWLDNLQSNNGWVLISGSEDTPLSARRFGTREWAPDAPALDITYDFPFFIGGFQRSGSTFKLFFSVEPFFSYTVERSTTLTQGSWTTLTNFTERVAAYEAVASDSILSPPSRRFYRVLKEPCNCR